MLIKSLIYGPLATWRDRTRPAPKPPGILVTFDDGPDPRYTPQLLDLLDRYQVKAIFFCLGHKVRRHPEIAHDILHRGHQIGLHGARHINAWLAGSGQVRRNIILGQRQLKKVGIEARWYRPPYGRINGAEPSDLPRLYWTRLFHDWDIRSQDDMFDRMIRFSRPGEIFLLHDSSEGRAVPGMPREMMTVLERWLSWARQSGVVICDGGRWQHD